MSGFEALRTAVVLFGLLNVPIYVQQNIHKVALSVIYCIVRRVN
jgi:hypothetical protein